MLRTMIMFMFTRIALASSGAPNVSLEVIESLREEFGRIENVDIVVVCNGVEYSTTKAESKPVREHQALGPCEVNQRQCCSSHDWNHAPLR
jgi:hypothetical protein